MTAEDISDIQDIPQDIRQDIPDIPQDIPDIPDSYDELAMDAVPQPTTKRGRGRPPGSRNRPKPETELEPETPSMRRKKPRPVPLVPPLDVAFSEGYGGAGPPKQAIRMSRDKMSSRPRTAGRTLLDLVAEATSQHAEQERGRRRAFYDDYLRI